MTIPEILKGLEVYEGHLPKEAMEAAIAQKEAITPELLRVLSEVASNPAKAAKDKDYALHIHALYMLAQFRETRAYPLIAQIARAPENILDDLLGDTVTDGLSRILGSVYDGNPAPLEKLVESPKVAEFVRAAALETFLILESSGQMPREEVAAYFQSLLRGKLERSSSHVWNQLVCSVAELPALELMEDVRKVFAEHLVDPLYIELEELESDLQSESRPDRSDYSLITDAIAELKWWDDVQNGPDWDKLFPTLDPAPNPLPLSAPELSHYNLPQPYIRPPKIGRNDPCPCGRGLKYKKCCGK